MHNDALAFVQLLQLADSALPVGAAGHSYGLETLVADAELSVDGLETFLRDYLAEAGALECAFCLLAHRLATQFTAEIMHGAGVADWLTLNQQLSAFKTARESRQASAALGRRLLQLAQAWQVHPGLPELVQAARDAGSETHYSNAFGLVGGLLGAELTSTGLAYLQQALSGLISICQRLLPLGQSQASTLLWRLHAHVLATVESCAAITDVDEICCFTALVDLGSMRHPALTTRLFIS